MKTPTTAPPTNHGSTVPSGLHAAPLLLSVKDVCVALNCGRTFVYTLLQHGELRAVKLGRLTRIPRTALEEFLAEKTADDAGDVLLSRPRDQFR